MGIFDIFREKESNIKNEVTLTRAGWVQLIAIASADVRSL